MPSRETVPAFRTHRKFLDHGGLRWLVSKGRIRKEPTENHRVTRKGLDMASTGYYFVSQQTTQRNPALSLKAQALHALVLGMPDDYCVWHADLQRRTGWGKDKTTSTITELVAYGLWVRESDRPKRGQCRYRVRETVDIEIPEDPGEQRIFRVRDEDGNLAYPWEDWGYCVERERFWGSDLDLETAWTLEILLGWPEAGRRHVTIERLALCFADGHKTARRVLANLTEAGHLHRIQGRDPGGAAFRWVTEVTEHPTGVVKVFDFEAERAVRRPAYLVDQARNELDATGTDDLQPVRVSGMPNPISIGMPLVLGDEIVHTFQLGTGTPVLCASRNEADDHDHDRAKEEGSNVVDFDAAEYGGHVRGRARTRARGRRKDRLAESESDPVGEDPAKEAERAEQARDLGEHERKQVRGQKPDASRDYTLQSYYGSFVHPDCPRDPHRASRQWRANHPDDRTPVEIARYFGYEAKRLGFVRTDSFIARNAEIIQRWVGDGNGPSAWEIHYMIDRFFEENAGRRDEIFDPFMEFTKRAGVLEHEARRALKARRQRVTQHRLREEQRAEKRKRDYVERAKRLQERPGS